MTVIAFLVVVGPISSLAADKIGFINLRQIMQNSTVGKKAAEDLKIFYEREARKIKSAEKEIKTMMDALDKQTSIMTQGARNEKESAYQKKLRDYQYLVKDTNEELKKRDHETTQKLMPGIMKIVRFIAEKEKYTLVIDAATLPIPYYAKGNDIIGKVIENYNKASQ